MPTETRTFSAEELEQEARNSGSFRAIAADMLAFAAQLVRERDALQRQVDGIRFFLAEGTTYHSGIPWHVAKRILAELDRLAAQEAQK